MCLSGVEPFRLRMDKDLEARSCLVVWGLQGGHGAWSRAAVGRELGNLERGRWGGMWSCRVCFQITVLRLLMVGDGGEFSPYLTLYVFLMVKMVHTKNETIKDQEENIAKRGVRSFQKRKNHRFFRPFLTLWCLNSTFCKTEGKKDTKVVLWLFPQKAVSSLGHMLIPSLCGASWRIVWATQFHYSQVQILSRIDCWKEAVT